jgi:hypothetical protein
MCGRAKPGFTLLVKLKVDVAEATELAFTVRNVERADKLMR